MSSFKFKIVEVDRFAPGEFGCYHAISGLDRQCLIELCEALSIADEYIPRERNQELFSVLANYLHESESEDEPDAHSCSANVTEYGICAVCGAIVSGTYADYELCGNDPY